MRKIIIGVFLLLILSSCSVDDNPPKISLNGEEELTVFLNETYSDPFVKVVDDVTSNPRVDVIGEVDTSVLGTYYIKYIATDDEGNQSEITRIVHVELPPLEHGITIELAYNYKDSIGLEMDFGIVRRDVESFIVEVFVDDELLDTHEFMFFANMVYEIGGLSPNIDYTFDIDITYEHENYPLTTYEVTLISGTLKSLPLVHSNTLNESKYDLLRQFVYVPYEEYDVNEVNEIVQRLSMIDDSILQDIIDYDIELHLSNHTVTFSKYYYYLKGVTPSTWANTGKTWDDIPGIGSNPVIAQIGQSHPGTSHGAVNLELHELAHAIDLSMYLISSSPEFLQVHSQEKTLLFGGSTFYDIPSEYFAETFAMYVLGGEERNDLLTTAPLTYALIEDLFN